MELMQGRPNDNNRLDVEIKTYDLLDELNIPFWRVDHDATATMEECIGVDEILGITICKNLFLCNRQKTNFYLLMMPGDKPFKTKDFSKLLGVSRLSFAPEEFMEEFLHIKPGSVSIMGLMNDKDNRVQLVIDKAVIDEEFIGCHPCANTSSLRIKTSDILEKFLPRVNHKPIIVDLPKHDENE